MLRTNPNIVIDIVNHIILTTRARTRTAARQSRIRPTRIGGQLCPEYPANSIRQALSCNHCATVTKGEDEVQEKLPINKQGEKRDLTRINAKETEVSGKIHLETHALNSGKTLARTIDGRDNAVHSRQGNLPVFSPVPLLRNPVVDAFS